MPEAIEDIRTAVREILELFRTRYKDTPVQVLSSLAEGSDRIVAEEAIGLGCDRCCSVVAPLPFVQVYAESSSFSSSMNADDVLTVRPGRRVPSFEVPLPKYQPTDDEVRFQGNSRRMTTTGESSETMTTIARCALRMLAVISSSTVWC